MENVQVTNPNDFKVVSFHNKEEFGFLPEMGCMYDGRGINSETGAPGINAGETKVLPYHIGHQLALNLAKYVLNKGASKETKLDPTGQPVIQAIWDTNRLEELKNSYLTEMYTEDRPVAQTETDKLFAKVAELEKFVRENTLKTVEISPEAPVLPVETTPVATIANGYQDKAEVIAELEKRGITHDKRQNKASLEKLLT